MDATATAIGEYREDAIMEIKSAEVQKFRVGTLKVEIYPDGEAAGEAAANAIAEYMLHLKDKLKSIGAIFATGASQLQLLRALTTISNLPWDQINGFHLDEYIGIDQSHPASFRRYLRENLTQRVPIGKFHEINGSAADPELVCREYARELKTANPQFCLLGFGENGHLAFNDPGEADFHDPEDVKVVHLDAVCRQQQASEGWFQTLQEVPERAITVTIPAIFRVPKLILTVPGKRKAEITRRVLTEPISEECPATIIRTHRDATVFLDREAAAKLDGINFN